MITSGFTNAPVTKLLVFGIILTSFLATLTDTKYFFWIEVRPHLLEYAQLWRLLTWQVCYTNSTEVLFAAMSLYQLRIIERLWGTRKFASFLIATLPYTTLLPPILLATVIRPISGATTLRFRISTSTVYLLRFQRQAPPSVSTALNSPRKQFSWISDSSGCRVDCRVCLQTGSPAWGCKVESAKLGHRRYRSERAASKRNDRARAQGEEEWWETNIPEYKRTVQVSYFKTTSTTCLP
ncbi:hypothetical protein KC361_g258 [Hortaea werneckii]|nr:hypothetical protein KC361_g258 [Hortaea werneckii]